MPDDRPAQSSSTTLKKDIATLPNVIDVTSQHLGKSFALLGAENLRKTQSPTADQSRSRIK